MADPAPLLTRSDSVEPEKHVPSIDSTIERYIGDHFSWPQFLQAVLVSLAWIFDAQQTFISVFTDSLPSWHCTRPDGETCTSSSKVCQLPGDSWTWDLPARTSVVSEWGLECAGAVITGLPASSFFIGCLVGGMSLATLADSSFGRKNMLFITSLSMGLFSLLTIYSPNIWVYSGLRFLTGFCRATIGTSALVLSTEIVGTLRRSLIGIVNFSCFTAGFLSLPAIAYVSRGSSWRNIYVYTSVPTILYSVMVRFFVPESPRWLFVRGRKEEAITTLQSMAPKNHILCSFSEVSFQQESWNSDIYSAIKILVQKKWAFKRLCAVMLVGFGIGMTYYGVPLALGNLAFNLYINVTLNALSEVPSTLITLLLLERSSRRASLLIFTLSSGFCSIMCVVMGRVWERAQIAVELLSFFSACTAFDLLLIYTIELFPTCVRNSAVSMVRQALVLGGVFSPVLAAAGRDNGALSFGVYGAVIFCCGLFAVPSPETKGRKLCDTMDEEEQKEKAIRENF